VAGERSSDSGNPGLSSSGSGPDVSGATLERRIWNTERSSFNRFELVLLLSEELSRSRYWLKRFKLQNTLDLRTQCDQRRQFFNRDQKFGKNVHKYWDRIGFKTAGSLLDLGSRWKGNILYAKCLNALIEEHFKKLPNFCQSNILAVRTGLAMWPSGRRNNLANWNE